MHLLRCHPNRFGILTSRHDRVKELLFQLLKDSLVANEEIQPTAENAIEIVVQQGTDNTREIKADIVVFTNVRQHNLARFVFDVSVVEPTNKHGRKHARGSAAAHQENAKRTLYRPVADADASTTIVPFVLESNGLVGTEASKFLTSLVDNCHSGIKKRIQTFLSDVSYALAKNTGWAGARARYAATSNLLAPPPAE